MEMTAWVARLMIYARHLYSRFSTNNLKSLDLPDLTMLDIKCGSGLEAVTTCKLLQHRAIVLHVVTSDMSNLYMDN